MIDKKKRDLFKRVSSLKSYIYPPYYEKKEDFLKCLECETKECVNACKENIIEIEQNRPVIKFGINGCTFCDECALACQMNVLTLENKKNKLNADFIINPSRCLAWNKTMCFSCQDICTENAIIYKGMFNPVIDFDKCTSCGFCISVCPTYAIDVKII